MTIFIDVVAGGQKMTMSVDQIIAINDIPYEANSHPSESSLAARVAVIEKSLEAVIHDLGIIVSHFTEEEPITPPEQAVEGNI